MPDDVATTQQPGRRADRTWREAVEDEIDGLGLRAGSRMERPDPGLTLIVLDGQVARDVTYYPEGPATFSLSLCFSGRGSFSIDGAAHLRFRPGSAVLFSSDGHVRGENTLAGGQRLHVLDIRFEKDVVTRLAGSSIADLCSHRLDEHSRREEGTHLIGFRAPPKLLRTAHEIVSCDLPEGLARRLFLHGKAIEALGQAVGAIGSGAKLEEPVQDHVHQRVERARAMIDRQVAADWTIARLAKQAGLSERQLKEGFRRVLGATVHAYLHAARLAKAEAVLESGGSVTDAALGAGFNSLSHFSKAFRAAKGVLPRDYRRSGRG